MAYDAGSVVFKLEIDDSNLNDVVKNIKDTFKNIKIDNSINNQLKEIAKRQTMAYSQQLKQQTNIQKTELKKQEFNYKETLRRQTAELKSQLRQQEAAQKAQNNQNLERNRMMMVQNLAGNMQGGLNRQNLAAATNSMRSLATYNISANNSVSGLSSKLKGFAAITSMVATAWRVYNKSISEGMTALKTASDIISKLSSNFVTGTINCSKFFAEFSGLSTVGNGIVYTLNEIGETVKEAFNFSSIRDFIKECTEVGSSLVEIENVLTTTFEKNSNTIENWAKNAVKQYGLAEVSASNFVATFGTMLKAGGVTGDKLSLMSENLGALTSDIASFRNDDFDTVFERIQSGISGQARALRAYGIDLTQTNLQQYMLQKGIKATYNNLDYESKLMIRYNYIVEKTRDLQGDYAKTFNTWANQLRYFNELLTQIKTNLGQGFINIFRNVLIVVNALMEKFLQLSKVFSDFTGKLFGNAQSTTAQASQDFSSLYDDMGDGAEKTSKKVKKAMSRTVSSFDELHKLTKNSKKSDNSVSLNLEPLKTNTRTAKNNNPVKKWINDILKDIKKAWAKADFTNLGARFGKFINSAINGLYNKLPKFKAACIKIGKSIATFLNGIFKEVDFEKLGETVSELLKGWMSGIISFFDNFNFATFGSKLADGINGFCKKGKDGLTVFDTFSEMLAKSFNGFFTTIRNFGKNLKGKEIGQNIGNGINNFFKTFNAANAGAAIQNFVSSILDIFVKTFQTADWGTIGGKLGVLFNNLFKSTSDGETIIEKVTTGIISLVNGTITALTNFIKTADLSNVTQQIVNSIKRIGQEIKWDELFSDLSELSKYFDEIITAINDEILKPHEDEIANIIGSFVGSVAKLGLEIGIIKIKAKLSGFFTTVGEYFKIGISNIMADTQAMLGAIFEYLKSGIPNTISLLDTMLLDLSHSMNAIPELLGKLVLLGFQKILAQTKELLANLKTSIGNKITWLKEKFSGIKESISSVFSNIKNTGSNAISFVVSSFKTGISNIKNGFTGLATAIKNIFSNTGALIKGAINSVLRVINSAITKLNEFSFKMPDALGGAKIGFSIPKIPMLANGGYVQANMPQLAVIGDNKSQGEIVAPENKIIECVTIALQEFLNGSFISALSSAISAAVQTTSTGNITIPLVVDGNELTRVTLTKQDINKLRGGVS